MRVTTRALGAVTASVLALGLAACGEDDGAGGGGDDAITVRGCNPENPLITLNTAETCGGDVLDVTTAKLIEYNLETGEPENDILESFETTDNINFTVKIKQGYKFSDDTEVKAKNFVDAWNYGAYQPNAQASSYFFGAAAIDGYDEVQCAETDDEGACTKDPVAETMSGLKVVDDYTFTIKTSQKVSNLLVRLGYTAFAPLPDVFFEDPEAFGEKPVGAGPYYVDSWDKTKQIVVKKNPHYSGDFPGNVEQITFKIYNDDNAAYKDVVSGKLDVINQVPTTELQNYKDDLEGRNGERDMGGIQTIAFDPKGKDAAAALAKPEVRQAISMAIDRQTIVDTIFQGTRQPATGWVSPVVDGFEAGACGEFCEFDPEGAKALLAEAGGFDGKLALYVNGDADHKPWADAACNSIRQNLEVECTTEVTKDFDQLNLYKEENRISFFRAGWQMDYPSIENFLAPLYGTGADSNEYSYSNPEFDAKLKEAAAATDPAEANALYQEAEKMLAADMPVIPTWYPSVQIGWSDRVNEVKIDPFGVPDYAGITLK
ncbi:MAG TPA: ABC transporter substrate-binding protein [Nocardioides sp.]|nr:ABC transporter substrate-binding protein [Nocardioides sp.]